MLEPLQISFETLNFAAILPMTISFCGAIIVLFAGIFTKGHKNFTALLCVLFLLGDTFYTAHTAYGQAFFGLITIDGYSFLGKYIAIAGALGFVLLSFTKHNFHEYRYPEFFALLLLVITGVQFMMSSTHLALILIGLETAALATYTMVALHHRTNALEAAIKYFSMGALATALFAFGAAFLYLGTGELNLLRIGERIANSQVLSETLIIVGALLVFAALAFKIGLVPFHGWVPDLYDGASSMMAGFMSVIPKIASFVVALRFFGVFLETQEWFSTILYAVSVSSMMIASLFALVQKDAKRMLAYSSIAQAGFGLAAILIHTPESANALFIYWSLFFVTNLGAFGMLYFVQPLTQPIDGKSDFAFERFAGLAKNCPISAILIAVFMLSLAGVPPLALFWGKFTLIGVAIQADFIILAFIMALNSAIAAFYYLKLVVYCFFMPRTLNSYDNLWKLETFSLRFIMLLDAIVVCLAVFWIQWLLDVIGSYIVNMF